MNPTERGYFIQIGADDPYLDPNVTGKEFLIRASRLAQALDDLSDKTAVGWFMYFKRNKDERILLGEDAQGAFISRGWKTEHFESRTVGNMGERPRKEDYPMQIRDFKMTDLDESAEYLTGLYDQGWLWHRNFSPGRFWFGGKRRSKYFNDAARQRYHHCHVISYGAAVKTLAGLIKSSSKDTWKNTEWKMGSEPSEPQWAEIDASHFKVDLSGLTAMFKDVETVSWADGKWKGYDGDMRVLMTIPERFYRDPGFVQIDTDLQLHDKVMFPRVSYEVSMESRPDLFSGVL